MPLAALLAGWQRSVPYGCSAMECVLVVDDEPAIRNLERAILRSAGYEVVTAANGVEALRVLEQRCPSVVLLDMQMPVMDGRTLFSLLNQREERPPVIIVANDAYQAQRETGAEAYVDKPFAPEDLLQRVEQVRPGGRPNVTL